MYATLASFSAETLKLRKRPAIKVLTTLFITTVILFGYLFTYQISKSPSNGEEGALLEIILRTENLVPVVLNILRQFGGPIALILGALGVGSEYGWGTVKTVLTQRPNRVQVVLGQVLALALLVAITVVLCFVTALAASLVVAQLKGWPASLPPAWDLARGIGAGWLMLLAWTMLGMTLANIFRGTALAVGLGLIYALLLETLIDSFAVTLEPLRVLQGGLPGPNAGAVVNSFHIGNMMPVAPLSISPAQGAAVLAVYILAGTLINALLQHRDVA